MRPIYLIIFSVFFFFQIYSPLYEFLVHFELQANWDNDKEAASRMPLFLPKLIVLDFTSDDLDAHNDQCDPAKFFQSLHCKFIKVNFYYDFNAMLYLSHLS